MQNETLVVSTGKSAREVRHENGTYLKVPADWELLPPGDAGLTRRVKAAGPTWTVKERKGRRVFSKGVWAKATTIAQAKKTLEAERDTDAYRKRRQADAARRDRKQTEYVAEFESCVLEFLRFDDQHETVARRLATAVSRHATPVGSGTVARTSRIPVEKRAESAVIAWMRHQTTAYDNLVIPRVRGKRREVRRMLAQQSRRLLDAYRQGKKVDPRRCPLQAALRESKAS
ncbi:MAG: DUF2293 domain-containing protein [Planctomycetota bacterium]